VSQERIDELEETWKNGNRKDVVEALGEMHPLDAALAGAYLYDRFETYDQGVFARLIQTRAPLTYMPAKPGSKKK
jgi:hypothetical protein